MGQDYNIQLLNYLSKFITPNRFELFNTNLENRTKHITVVLEDIFQPHNASAVLRTCDCFGIQDVHIIENKNEYNVNPDVALGASKWLNLFKYNSLENNTLTAYRHLKEQGYRIVATTPHQNDYDLNELSIDQKTALIFGTELNGLSDAAIKNADAYVKIPMYGFTESFNISVSAAIILHSLTERLKHSGIDWKLDNEASIDTLLLWMRSSIKRVELLEKEFRKNY